jgi:hypothetical protein
VDLERRCYFQAGSSYRTSLAAHRRFLDRALAKLVGLGRCRRARVARLDATQEIGRSIHGLKELLS